MGTILSPVSVAADRSAEHSFDSGNHATVAGAFALNLCYHDDRWAEELAYECTLANKKIQLCAMSMTPPWSNSANAWVTLWHSWVRAVQRGVQVDMWLASPQSMPSTTSTNKAAAAACLRAGIAIHFIRGSRLMHAKTAVIDGKHVWVGSGNFTLAACTSNHESFIRVTSEKFATTIQERLLGLR